MARLSLNKSTLSSLIRQLKTYENFLPSLDLKRRQLLSEQEKARQELRELDRRKEELRPMVEKQKAALGELQNLGCLHLASVREESRPVAVTAPEWDESVAAALRHLIAAPRRRHQEIDPENFNVEEIVKTALKNKERQREAADRRISLRSRISQLSPWGNFRLPLLDEMGGYRLWFYRIPHRELKRVNKLTDPWEIVAKDHRFAYVVVISKEEPHAEILPVPRTHAGEVALEELKRHLQRVELEIEDLTAEHNALSRWIELLTRNLAVVEDQRALVRAARQSREIDNMYMLQGWSPSRDLPALQLLAEAKGIALLQEDPGPDETPPTLMENPVPCSILRKTLPSSELLRKGVLQTQ